MLELKHVSLYEGLADLLIGPGDEELVVVIGFLRQPGGEVNGGFQIHSFPSKTNRQQLHTILLQHRVYECCNRIRYITHIQKHKSSKQLYKLTKMFPTEYRVLVLFPEQTLESRPKTETPG